MGGSVSKRNSDERIGGGGVTRTDSEKRPRTSKASDLGGLGQATPASRLDMAALTVGSPAGPTPGADSVPTVFRWDHGGNQVYITGTFNNWSHKVPMHRSGNEFSYICSLPKRKHAYKFIVDDEWRFSPEQPTITDTAGNVNNYIDLTTFHDDSEIVRSKNDSLVGIPFTIEDDDSPVTKEPPTLPPHLRHITLNSAMPPSLIHTLPKPQHVMLNHLYCTTIVDKLIVQAVSLRYRTKSVTTVFYGILPQAQSEILAAQVARGGDGDDVSMGSAAHTPSAAAATLPPGAQTASSPSLPPPPPAATS